MRRIDPSGNINESLDAAITDVDLDGGVVLFRNDLSVALERCARGEIDKDELTKWASRIEYTECIFYERGAEKIISEIIFCISSPEINGSLDARQCEALIRELRQKS